ncbi:MAG TPA: crosslink repair DNA glycosylase YcaQ family protein [Chloroflexia bacterium]|nr:crosslink repair DNA glycosylase YcaQ family protein [Chloroflexia bacterium]
MQTLTPTLARRLAITRQRLAGPRPAPDAAGILEVVRDLGCLQLDPTSAVARSHLLVLWSRLGAYDPRHLDTLLWEDRALFEYWAHAASMVLTEDYPIHAHWMRQAQTGTSNWGQHVSGWIAANHQLHTDLRAVLAERGPLMARDIPDTAAVPWESTGWTGGRNVDRMLTFLWTRGEVTVAGRRSGQRLWDLTERHLPATAGMAPLTEAEVVRQSAQKAIRALGVATPAQIKLHFVRDGYPDLEARLAELEAEGLVAPVAVAGDAGAWPGPWYIHTADLPLLESLAGAGWQPRTTLLSPFDNLICDRDRTQLLWDFYFRLEIYTPVAQRQYGYFVLPILHGDRLIGRIDPRMDRKAKRLHVNAVYAEPGAPDDPATATAIAGAVTDLAGFLGAREIVYTARVPDAWAGALRSEPV